jgi:hypothetical protein
MLMVSIGQRRNYTDKIFFPIVGIVSLGDSVSYALVRPILESCSAVNLRRLEDATPVSRSYPAVISFLCR